MFEVSGGVKVYDDTRIVSDAYGENAIGENTSRKWFFHFQVGHFEMNDSPRSAKSSDFDKRLNTLIYDNLDQSGEEFKKEDKKDVIW